LPGAGHPSVVRLLLERGAAVGIKDRFGNTALGYALKKGHVGVIKLLRTAGARLEMTDAETAAELCYCVMQGKSLQVANLG